MGQTGQRVSGRTGRWLARMGTVCAALLLGAAVSTAAPAHPLWGSPGTATVHPAWRVIRTGLVGVGGQSPVIAATDRYLLLATQPPGVPVEAAAFTLVDEVSGVKLPIALPACADLGGVALDDRYFAVECQQRSGTAVTAAPEVHLLNLARGTWSARTLSATRCGVGTAGCLLGAVGRRWLEVTALVSSAHQLPHRFLENIASGAVLDVGRAPEDLDTASGRARACTHLPAAVTGVPGAPLDLDFLSVPSASGLFSQYGRFVVSTGSFDPVTGSASAGHLTECGTRIGFAIPIGVAATSRMIVWQTPSSGIGVVHGLTLPGLRPFVLGGRKGELAAVSGRTIYETLRSRSRHTWSVYAEALPRSLFAAR